MTYTNIFDILWGFCGKILEFVEKFTTKRCKCGELRYNHLP